MIAPLNEYFGWGDSAIFLASLFIGVGFGFALESAGFGNSTVKAHLFYFKNFTVFKVMFTAILFAMFGIYILTQAGFLNIESIFIVPTYIWAQLIGGLIMGAGFVIGGFCPGTSMAGLATLKLDAAFFVIGMLFGAIIFGETFPFVKNLYNGEASGDMGYVTLPGVLGIPAPVIILLITAVAFGGFFGISILEKKSSVASKS